MLNGQNASFLVTEPLGDAPDVCRRGKLEAVGTSQTRIRYLKFRDGPYWLKSGCDAPEKIPGNSRNDDTLKKRKEAIDYLAQRGVNSLYIMCAIPVVTTRTSGPCLVKRPGGTSRMRWICEWEVRPRLSCLQGQSTPSGGGARPTVLLGNFRIRVSLPAPCKR